MNAVYASRPPLLLAGIPRCGSTWTMRALDSDPTILLVNEPDNEGQTASAIWAKRELGRFPVLSEDADDPRYRRLWDWAIAGAPTSRRLIAAGWLLNTVQPEGRRRFYQGRMSPRMQLAGALGARPGFGRRPELERHRLLVKSVHAPLALEWLTKTYGFEVFVLFRHPGNVLASWIALDLTDRFARMEDHPAIRARLASTPPLPRRGVDPIARIVWLIGLLTLMLEESTARHPEWVVRTHEELCRDPVAEFRRLFADLHLPWCDAVEDFLTENDRPGQGFAVRRVASDAPGAWKSRLTPGQIDTLQQVLAEFPLTRWTTEDLVP